MALACIGTPLTPSSSLIAKKMIFTFILELLNDRAPYVESYFNTKNSARKTPRKTQKRAQPAKEELNSRHPIGSTLADETGGVNTLPDETDTLATATIPVPVSLAPALLDPPMPVKPHAEVPRPTPQQNPSPPAATTDLQTPLPLSESTEPHSLSPTFAEVALPYLVDLPLEEQCRTLLSHEESGIQSWLMPNGKVNLHFLRATCKECPSRATAVKIHSGLRNTHFYQKCQRHANFQCFSFTPYFEDWVNRYIPMDPPP